MPLRPALLGLALLVVPVLARAQPATPAAADAPDARRSATETNRGSIIPFLEGTDVFVTSDDGMVFEANIQPHLVGFQNFTDSMEITKRKTVSVSISGTPGVRIRMFDSVSRPVRTPSYQPRVNVQMLWLRDRDRVLAGLGDLRSRTVASGPLQGLVRMGLWEGHVIVGHHSNGQDGCLFITQQRDADGVCQPADQPFDPDLVNRTDGSFSTNFIRTGVNYRRNYLAPVDQGALDAVAVKEFTLRGDIEWHPRAWVDEDIVDYYGRLRLKAGGHWARSRAGAPGWQCPRRLQAGGGVEYISTTPEDVPHWAFTVEGSCFPTENGGWGLFVRFYTGQDYYNLGFIEDITRLHVGVTYNPDGFFRFVRR